MVRTFLFLKMLALSCLFLVVFIFSVLHSINIFFPFDNPRVGKWESLAKIAMGLFLMFNLINIVNNGD
jgi:hypothetical protein